ncbi:MAG: lipid-A-disaccharide synthase [Bacteroidales bacterium]|nr:lipid-A-disaccharide synthase [Bacteroidales bacterium]
MARYYVIAGESSGDMHGANLMKSIRTLDPDAGFRFWGGDRMSAVAGEPVRHVSDLAFMGFWEVLINLKKILKNIRFCKQDLLRYNPDVLILIDYPGFNLRMAQFAAKHNIKVVYYISPQIWAWKQNRIKTIRKTVDKMLVILPFEQDFYKRLGMEVEFTGHPLLDELIPLKETSRYDDFRSDNNLDDTPIVALLPGSRKQEVSRMLRGMTEAAGNFPDHQFVVAGVSSLGMHFYKSYTGASNVSVVLDQTYALLANARAALVASGTATLETALFGVPQAVCYKANVVSYHIARKLVNIKFISLVNLIMDKAVLQELIQHNFNPAAVQCELQRLLFDEAYRNSMQSEYRQVYERLGGTGASRKAAEHIIDVVGYVNQ